MKRVSAIFIAVAALVIFVIVAQAAGPTGAIFTTTPNGGIVNENVRYNTKPEVYLDGGPGPNAPQTAAGLDDGWYVFQVTDPSGKYLLSQDPAKCRVFEVANGIIVRLVNPTEFGLTATYTVGKTTYPCHIQDAPDGVAGKSARHDTNIDIDHGGNGAIVVQLMPFGDTPNPGGVYKAWAQKFDTYISKGGNLGLIPAALKGTAAKGCPNFCAQRDPGFGPANYDTKTDNFKVKMPGKPPIPPEIEVKKFHDKNANGIFDGTDEWVTGWLVNYTDPLGLPSTLYTPWIIVAEPSGAWTFTEATPAGTLQTASFVDGLATLPFPANPVAVTVAGTSGEKHQVVFGNVGLGKATICKAYDRNANDIFDEGELLIAGWKMELTGTLANGATFTPLTQATGEDGCTTFGNLLPGSYTVTELMSGGDWFASGAVSYSFDIVSTLSGAEISANTVKYTFNNYCTGYADFGTKGYWHNKNGLDEITQADIDYVNSLPVYAAPTYYWNFPFDGVWAAGNDEYFGEGAWAEISDFLPDRVNSAPAEMQLSQQLLAFIFNTRHRLDGPGATIWTGTQWMSAQSIIDAAIAAWQSPGTADDLYWKDIIDALNNGDAIPYLHYYACPVVYP